MRTQQLATRFAIQRKALLSGSTAFFLDLFREVQEEERRLEVNYELVSRLLHCVELYPNEENSYVVVGNYLIDHPHAHAEF